MFMYFVTEFGFFIFQSFVLGTHKMDQSILNYPTVVSDALVLRLNIPGLPNGDYGEKVANYYCV